MDDAGTYLVKAINIDGEAKCSCALKILQTINVIPSMNTEPFQPQPTGFPPEFLQLFIDRQTAVQSTIKFEARLIGSQPLNVRQPLPCFVPLQIDLFRPIGYSMEHRSRVCRAIHDINNALLRIPIL
jgi:hypothetical protein